VAGAAQGAAQGGASPKRLGNTKNQKEKTENLKLMVAATNQKTSEVRAAIAQQCGTTLQLLIMLAQGTFLLPAPPPPVPASVDVFDTTAGVGLKTMMTASDQVPNTYRHNPQAAVWFYCDFLT
jgi:hypothetical protein